MLPTHRRSLLLALLAAPFAAAAQGRHRTITWDDLMPKGWDPFKDLKGLDPGAVREGSAGESELMREMRKVWDNAPTRPELAGQALRLPGYVVPLDGGGGAGPVKEFLLVPYFGACIHSPPPPSNQIVHVTLRQGAPLKTMAVVWVSGKLSIQRENTSMGVSSYAMAADTVEPYKETPAR